MKKGFTLIELLAVIIILAVIALIATPIVLNVVNSAKLKAFEESSYGIIETVKLKNYEYMFEGTDTNKTYTFPNDELVFQGEKPKGGTVVLQNGEIVLAIHNGKYCASKKAGDEKIIITEDIENCDLKLVSLSGNITGVDTNITKETYNQTIPIEGKVQLIRNNRIAYETNSDSEGNYSFEDIVADQYLLLVSQPYTTKFGMELIIDEDTVKDMDVTLYWGDFNNDGIKDGTLDRNQLDICWGSTAVRPECDIYDFDQNGVINFHDSNRFNISKFGSSKVSVIDNSNMNISGKIEASNLNKLRVVISNDDNKYEVDVAEDGTFSFENIQKGYYQLNVKRMVNVLGKVVFIKFKHFYSDMDELNIVLYSEYDLNSDNFVDEEDIDTLMTVINELESGVTSYEDYDDIDMYDLNNDKLINENDLEILKDIVAKNKEQQKSDLNF